MENKDIEWAPLIIDEPAVLIRYYQLKLISSYRSDCEFLISLLDLLESYKYSGESNKHEEEEEQPDEADENDEQEENDEAADVNDVEDQKFPVGNPEEEKPVYNDDYELPVECVVEEGSDEVDDDVIEDVKPNIKAERSRSATPTKTSKEEPKRPSITPSGTISYTTSHNSCYNCFGVFVKSTNQLKEHFRKQHPGEKPFKCISCGECFTEILQLRHHKAKLRHKGFYRCEQCDKTFYRNEHFQEHNLRWHVEGQSFPCDQCDKKYYLWGSLCGHKKKAHLVTSVSDPEFTCTHCPNIHFLTLSELTNHLSTVHPSDKKPRMGVKPKQKDPTDGLYSCYLCQEFRFDSPNSVKIHFDRAHANAKPFKCVTCEEFFVEFYELKRHVVEARHHGCFQCDQCERSFYRVEYFQEHIRRWHSGGYFPCDKCNKKFFTEASLQMHQRTHAHDTVTVKKKYRYECSYCSEVLFETIPELNNHVREAHADEVAFSNVPRKQPSKDDRDFSCYICPGDKELLTAVALKEHFQDKHPNNQPFKCPSCVKIFAEVKELKVHMKTSRHRTPENCDQCEKVFSSRLSLIYHKRRTHEIKTYQCDQCSRSFTKRENLTIHKEAKHNSSTVCDECGKVCRTASVLREHKNSHTGVRVSCDLCKKTYLSQSILRAHIKFCHSDPEKPLPCHVCGNFYRTEMLLKQHIRTHDKDRTRNFNCDVCNKKFMKQHHLNVHVRYAHLNIREFICEFCSKAFQQKTHLKTHIQRIHTVSGRRERKKKKAAVSESSDNGITVE